MKPLFSTALLAASLLAVAACSKAAKKSAPAPVPVEVVTVATQTVPIDIASIGSVEPIASVQLKSKVQGEILGVNFSDGSMVKAGDVLFRIDPRPFEAALKRAQANFATAKAEASNASEQAKRYTTLINRGAASKEQFAQFLTTAESQMAGLDARQADLDEAQLSLGWTQVQAPISGRVGAALLKAGNIVQANTEVLAVINQIKPIYVGFALPESSLSDVRARMAESAKVPVTARDAATGRVLGTGELSFIDNAVDRASAMVAFKGVFPNEDETLWPGQFVDVSIRLSEQADAIVVPTAAIMEGQKGNQVFIVENGAVTLRPVEVEREAGPLSVIKTGLQPGEVIVTSGQLRLSPGSKVSAKNAPVASSSPTAP